MVAWNGITATTDGNGTSAICSERSPLRLHERLFVLAPMSELAPALIHPKLNHSISEIMAALKSPFRVSLARAELLHAQPAKRLPHALSFTGHFVATACCLPPTALTLCGRASKLAVRGVR